MNIKDNLIKNMADALDQVNVYYSSAENINRHEIDLFNVTAKALDKYEECMRVFSNIHAVNRDESYDWKKHISVLFITECENIGFDPDKIKRANRKPDIVNARQKIAKALHPKFNYCQIGWAMQRDHTSIRHLIKVRR